MRSIQRRWLAGVWVGKVIWHEFKRADGRIDYRSFQRHHHHQALSEMSEQQSPISTFTVARLNRNLDTLISPLSPDYPGGWATLMISIPLISTAASQYSKGNSIATTSRHTQKRVSGKSNFMRAASINRKLWTYENWMFSLAIFRGFSYQGSRAGEWEG